MRTNWEQLAEFYRIGTLSKRVEYAEHFLSMLKLIEKLSSRPERNQISAIIEKFDLILWNNDASDVRVYVSSENGSYKFSLNDFLDSQTIDETRIVLVILEYLSGIG